MKSLIVFLLGFYLCLNLGFYSSPSQPCLLKVLKTVNKSVLANENGNSTGHSTEFICVHVSVWLGF